MTSQTSRSSLLYLIRSCFHRRSFFLISYFLSYFFFFFLSFFSYVSFFFSLFLFFLFYHFLFSFLFFFFLMNSLGPLRPSRKTLYWCSPFIWLNVLLRQVLDHPTKVLYGPENEVLFLPQFWLFPIYRELLNTASRNRPSKDSEVRRAASGLVKVLCTANDSTFGGKGSRKGKPLKQGGALTRFNEWFGSA